MANGDNSNGNSKYNHNQFAEPDFYYQNPFSDRNFVEAVKEMTALRQSIDRLNEKISTVSDVQDSHETRIRAIERFQYILIGMGTLLGVLTTVVSWQVFV